MEKLSCKGKDCSPEETSKRILRILAGLGLQFDYSFMETGVEGCCSARVFPRGNLSRYIGTNGKGTTESFCLASGYAEMMERLQNGIFLYGVHYADLQTGRALENMEKDSVYKTWDELFAEDGYINTLIRRCEDSMTKVPRWLRRQAAEDQFKITFSRMDGGIPLVPFYHVNRKEYDYFPEQIARFFVMSNGMAAGNTLEEALVQGYSEIFERLAQREMILNKITPPRLPDDVVGRYPYIRQMIGNIERQGPYQVILCDCSLGKNLPVVCGFIVNTHTHTYGIRFGAHPNMGIALERVLTESLQGKNLEQFTKFSTTVFSRPVEDNDQNIFNNMKIGAGYYPASIFASRPSYEFAEWAWNGNGENKDLAFRMSRKIQEEGYDIYIKDVSFLDFPSVFIVVPGISELRPSTLLYLKELKLKFSIMDDLFHIDRADENAVARIIRYGKVSAYSALENSINALYSLPLDIRFHGGSDEIDFLLAVCYYFLGNIPEAFTHMNRCRMRMSESDEDYVYVSLAEKLLLGKAGGYDPAVIRDYLRSVSDGGTFRKVTEDFDDPGQILSRLYPHFDSFTALAAENEQCHYGELCEFYLKIHQAQLLNNSAKKHLHILFDNYA